MQGLHKGSYERILRVRDIPIGYSTAAGRTFLEPVGDVKRGIESLYNGSSEQVLEEYRNVLIGLTGLDMLQAFDDNARVKEETSRYIKEIERACCSAKSAEPPYAGV